MRVKGWLICLLLIFSLPGDGTESLSGRPLRVLSGDRLVLLGNDGSQYRIRLKGISADPPNEYWGAAAKRYLTTLVMGRFLTVQYQSQGSDGDLLAKLLHGGADMNRRLIQAGLARHNPAGQTSVERISYAAAEQEARRSRQGVWSRANSEVEKRGRSMPGGPLFRSPN